MSSPSCHSSLNSLDNLQYQFLCWWIVAIHQCKLSVSTWSRQSIHSSQVPLLCEPESLPCAPAFPWDEALPRLSVLLGCSWWAETTVLASDLAVILAGIWARIYFHGQVPSLEESWWTSKRRGLGSVQRQAAGHGVVPMQRVGPSALWAPPSKTLGRWVLREGVVSVSFCINFGTGFSTGFPWSNCSDNCLFPISIYRAFIEAKRTYALCHCRGVKKVAGTSFPTLPFIVQKLFWRNWKGLPASCFVLPGST